MDRGRVEIERIMAKPNRHPKKVTLLGSFCHPIIQSQESKNSVMHVPSSDAL